MKEAKERLPLVPTTGVPVPQPPFSTRSRYKALTQNRGGSAGNISLGR